MDVKMASVSIEPMESLAAVHTLLKWTGFLKVDYKPKDKVKRIFFKLYRCLSILAVILVNLQRIAFIVQMHGNGDYGNMFDGLMLEIPDLNLLVKYFTLNLQSKKIDRMYALLKNPVMAAKNKNDEELLTKNKEEMHNMFKIIVIGITPAAIFWPLYYFAKRYLDETTLVPLYVPFNTDSWSSFTWCVIIELLPLPWIGYGHISIDCLVATYYAQAQTQFKIIKYNLEHLFDKANNSVGQLRRNLKYSIEHENDVRRRFIHYVKRYKNLVWFIKEVDSIFNISTSFQFFTSTVSLCGVIYRISTTSVLSFQFVFLFALLNIYSVQVFLYCFFGNLVQYESTSMNDSIYLSDWYSASPILRRTILIAMYRWHKITTPKVCWIIPLSLPTFVSITRFAYSIFAVLTTTKE